jgi:hypothetical protein
MSKTPEGWFLLDWTGPMRGGKWRFLMRRLSIHKRLAHLEALQGNQAGVPIGAQTDVTAAIAGYLEQLREWRRSAAAKEPNQDDR